MAMDKTWNKPEAESRAVDQARIEAENLNSLLTEEIEKLKDTVKEVRVDCQKQKRTLKTRDGTIERLRKVEQAFKEKEKELKTQEKVLSNKPKWLDSPADSERHEPQGQQRPKRGTNLATNSCSCNAQELSQKVNELHKQNKALKASMTDKDLKMESLTSLEAVSYTHLTLPTKRIV